MNREHQKHTGTRVEGVLTGNRPPFVLSLPVLPARLNTCLRECLPPPHLPRTFRHPVRPPPIPGPADADPVTVVEDARGEIGAIAVAPRPRLAHHHHFTSLRPALEPPLSHHVHTMDLVVWTDGMLS